MLLADVLVNNLNTSQTNAGGKRETIKTNQDQDLSRILELAVASRADLIRGVQTGPVHIEYGFAPSGILDFLQVWSAISRGHWLLACSCRMSPSAFHQTGVYFEIGYEPECLAHILESVIRHQAPFTVPQNLGRHGLLQIPRPTEEESAAAAASVKEICEYFCSGLAQLALA